MFPTNGDAPSVTTILGVLAKPALVGWAAREERRMIAALAGQLYSRLFKLVDEPVTPEKFVEILLDEAGKGAHRTLLEKAANVGTQVHKRIEWTLKGELGIEREPVEPPLNSPQAQRSWDRWLEWRVQVQLKVVAIEKAVFSGLFGYGGTLDLLAEVDGILSVLDFKTGKAVYSEAYLQNVAYRMALMEEGIEAKGGWIIRLPKEEIDPEFDAVQVPDDPQLSVVWIALGPIYRWWDKESKKRKYAKTTPTNPLVGAGSLPDGVQ